MTWPVFWCEPTGEGVVSLRRFTFSTDAACPGSQYGHNAQSGPVDQVPYRQVPREDRDGWVWESGPSPSAYRGSPSWPATCAECGYEFSTEMPDDAVVLSSRDNWQVHVDPIYRRVDTGEEFVWGSAAPGAMRDSWGRTGPDGIALQVRCPRADGSPSTIVDDWNVDSRASNCTKRDDSEHYCWVRHGDPHATPPTVYVDKDAPNTCDAGAGSIQTHRWHGFLRDGKLVV